MTTRSKELFELFKRDYNGQRLLKLYSPDIKPRLYLTVDEDGLFGFLLRTESAQKLPVSSNKLSISYKEINGFNHVQIGLLETRLLTYSLLFAKTLFIRFGNWMMRKFKHLN